MGDFLSSVSSFPSGSFKKPWEMAICLDKDTLSGLPVRDRIFEKFWKIKYRPTFRV